MKWSTANKRKANKNGRLLSPRINRKRRRREPFPFTMTAGNTIRADKFLMMGTPSYNEMTYLFSVLLGKGEPIETVDRKQRTWTFGR